MIFNMIRYRLWFLFSSSILILMGALLKLDNHSNYKTSMIAGVLNLLVFVWLTMLKNRKQQHQKQA